MIPGLAQPWMVALASLAVALGIGLLVGLERERSQTQADVVRFGGIRTFGLLSLLGALGGLLQPVLGWWVPALIGLLVGVAVMGSAVIGLQSEQGKGFTTEVAAMVCHFLGLLASTDLRGIDEVHRWGLVAAVGTATMTVLSLRNPLHRLAERVSSEDLYATAKLGLLLLVVLPLLPNKVVGPIPRFNPFEVGLLVTLIAAIGFVGYVSVRFAGTSRGMTFTGLVGGLASSTAVALNFAGRVREARALAPVAALGIALASTIMFPRMLIEVAVTDARLLEPAAWALGAMGVVGIGLTGALYWVHRKNEDPGASVEIRNPFSLDQAVKFALAYVAILVVSDLALREFGSTGLYVSALLAGLTDVDAITLTIGRLHRDGLDTRAAEVALVLAAASNTATKAGIALALGGWQLGYRVLGIFAPTIAVGAAVLAWRYGV